MQAGSFTQAGDDDVPGIAELMNRAYRGAGAASGWSTEAAYISGDRTTAGLLRADLRAMPEASLLKWTGPQGDGLLGCVWLQPLGQGVWYLGALATEVSRQNAGLGRTLLASAEAWVRQRGGLCIRMTVVNVRDTLIAWYLRRGYALTGETEAFPYDDGRFGTPLRSDLCFLVLEKRLDVAGPGCAALERPA